MERQRDEILVLSDLLPKKAMTAEEIDRIKDQTKQLLGQYQKGDTAIRNQIVLLNLGLVYAKVSDWMRVRTLTGHELFTREDLLQECFVKLIECVDTYDGQRAAFSTYVYGQLNLALRHQFEKYSLNTFSSRYLYQTSRKIRQCIAQYQESYGKNPSLDEIAQELNLTKLAVLSAYEGGQVSQSLQQPVYQSDDADGVDEWGDVVASNAHETMIRREELRDLREILLGQFQMRLTPQEQKCVSLVLSQWDGVGKFPFGAFEKKYGYHRNCLGQPFRNAMRKLNTSSQFADQVHDYLPMKVKGQKRL